MKCDIACTIMVLSSGVLDVGHQPNQPTLPMGGFGGRQGMKVVFKEIGGDFPIGGEVKAPFLKMFT